MSKNKNGYGAGTFIDTRMFLSEAFLSLNGRSRKTTQVLIMFLGKRRFSKVTRKGQKIMMRSDENEFTLTYKEVESRNISRGAFTRAIDELLEKGFIKIVNPGGAYKQDKAKYAIVDDYLSWRPDDPPIRKRSRDVRRGFQGAGLGAVNRSEDKDLTNFSHPQTEPCTHALVEPCEGIHTHPDGTIKKNPKNRKAALIKAILG